MSSITIEGGNPLVGTIQISGAKNSALKLMALALFSNEDVVLENVPRMKNVTNDIEIIEALGAKAEWVGKNKLVINASTLSRNDIPLDLGSKYRTAALYASALLFRFGRTTLPKPGGCKIGFRPMNRWVTMWESLGIDVTEDEANYYLDSKNIKGGNVSFKVNTHMGTDAAILFSIFAPGETIINNAAEEPEIDDLIELANLMGAVVTREDSRRIKVIGMNQFNGANFTIQADRNEAVTFSVAALVTNGNITMKGVDKSTLLSFTNLLTKMGAKFEFSNGEMRVWKTGESLEPIDIKTGPYPGIMTDWQPLLTLLLTQIEGGSYVHDTVYWDRFIYTKELNRMGAKIELKQPSSIDLTPVVSDDTYDWDKQGEPYSVALVNGSTKLRGSKLMIPDLRAGATLVLAALLAEGRSVIFGFEHVTRGYEDFASKLLELGAKIVETD